VTRPSWWPESRRRRRQRLAAKAAADAASEERLKLAHAAVDIQRARYSSKLASSNTRASFLIAGSALALTFDGVRSELHAVPVIVLLLSASIAVFAMRPGKVEEFDVEELRAATAGLPARKTEFVIYRAKLDSLESARQHLQPREKALLVSSAVFLFGVLLIGIENGRSSAMPGEEDRSPSVSTSMSATIGR
jgi:hypothetical protein